jgi:hypothetical protein
MLNYQGTLMPFLPFSHLLPVYTRNSPCQAQTLTNSHVQHSSGAHDGKEAVNVVKDVQENLLLCVGGRLQQYVTTYMIKLCAIYKPQSVTLYHKTSGFDMMVKQKHR